LIFANLIRLHAVTPYSVSTTTIAEVQYRCVTQCFTITTWSYAWGE